MFSLKNVKLFLQKLTFSVDENEAVQGVALIYVTPVTKGLADSIEMQEDIVSALFNRNGKPWAHLNTIGFKTEPEACSLEYILHEEVKSGRGLIPYVEFSGVHAMKLFTDSPDWTLAFKMKFECNDKELAWNFINRIKKTFLGTFGKVQGELFPKKLPACAAEVLVKEGSKDTKECGVSPKYKVKGRQEFYCHDHARAAGAEADLDTLSKDEIAKWAKAHADKGLETKKAKKKGAGR